MPVNKNIDHGKCYDWGRVSADYAKYRDIYPAEFFQRIADLGLCVKGQKVLDFGTGTGVLPRNMHRYGAQFTGTDISENQIAEARRLTDECGMKIDYLVSPAERLEFQQNTFDVITACQCFFYFDHIKVMPKITEMLKPGGCLVVLYMVWLPQEDKIAEASENLVLKYNPVWSGANATKQPVFIPEIYDQMFEKETEFLYDLEVPFTRESWNGRMKACRGVGASLSDKHIADFEKEHRELLNKIAPEHFTIRHYAAVTVLKVKK
ncbi:MAG TPA: methyltransferase domain-containing protein [Caproiciproducens sp.]|nr:methyltransferase domain-containing protein [Caproiciproducens sp.]